MKVPVPSVGLFSIFLGQRKTFDILFFSEIVAHPILDEAGGSTGKTRRREREQVLVSCY